MLWARSQAVQRSQMLGGAVTLVLGEAVAWITLVQFDHPSVTGGFGKNAGGGDGSGVCVAFDDEIDRDGERLEPFAVH